METKKSILKEAILEFNELMEAAKDKAKDDMAKEFPDKFNKIMNEHIEKLNNMKKNINEKAETFKEEPKTEKAKEIGKTEDTDKRKEGGDGVDKDVEKTFTKEPKKGTKKINESYEDDIDLTDFSMDELEEAFNGADDEDDFEIDDEIELDLGDSELDLDDISAEIAKMDKMSEEFEVDDLDEDVDDPYTKLKKLQEEMNQIIDNINKGGELQEQEDPMIQEFDEKMSGVYGENYKDVLGSDYDKMLDLYKSQSDGEPKHFNDEENVEVSMDKDEVEEAHGVSLSNNKKVGSETQPRPEYADYKKDKLRFALQREQLEKRVKALVSENKNTKINFNKLKKKTAESNKLLENYRNVIDKYRNSLNEMVVFNTNLAHVNNLLIDENFDFNVEDKKEIVERFKPVQSIDESEKVYKEILSENSNGKKDIVESIEKKYNNVVTPSSKQKIGEAVEKSAFKKDKHIEKLKRLVNYNMDRK